MRALPGRCHPFSLVPGSLLSGSEAGVRCGPSCPLPSPKSRSHVSTSAPSVSPGVWGRREEAVGRSRRSALGVPGLGSAGSRDWAGTGPGVGRGREEGSPLPATRRARGEAWEWGREPRVGPGGGRVGSALGGGGEGAPPKLLQSSRPGERPLSQQFRGLPA